MSYCISYLIDTIHDNFSTGEILLFLVVFIIFSSLIITFVFPMFEKVTTGDNYYSELEQEIIMGLNKSGERLYLHRLPYFLQIGEEKAFYYAIQSELKENTTFYPNCNCDNDNVEVETFRSIGKPLRNVYPMKISFNLNSSSTRCMFTVKLEDGSIYAQKSFEVNLKK